MFAVHVAFDLGPLFFHTVLRLFVCLVQLLIIDLELAVTLFYKNHPKPKQAVAFIVGKQILTFFYNNLKNAQRIYWSGKFETVLQKGSGNDQQKHFQSSKKQIISNNESHNEIITLNFIEKIPSISHKTITPRIKSNAFLSHVQIKCSFWK